MSEPTKLEEWDWFTDKQKLTAISAIRRMIRDRCGPEIQEAVELAGLRVYEDERNRLLPAAEGEDRA